MNIKEAKMEVEKAVKIYLEKDENGEYRVPLVRQRPLFLVGAPGLGKTAIMEQVAEDLDIALVSYSMTHHTRQSAIGLPYLKEVTYNGQTYTKSEYTMSEIIASVYDVIQSTGKKEGILFLDEINSMDISLQAKLLKVIENKTVRRIGDMKEREIRCRILCALNEAPLACIENGKLRRDLYYRLSSCILYIPPLRERKSDIPLLCSFFLKHFNKEYGRHIHRIDPELMDRFLEYPWPGNVRELQHVVESAFSVSRKDMEILQLGHLSHYYREFFTACKPEAVSDSQAAPGPVSPCNPQPLKAYMDSCEKNFLAAALCCHSNNITATARSLQITRQALQHKIRKYGL